MSKLDKDSLNSLYEDLRGEVLGTSASHHRKSQGLTLFIHKGMAAWVEAWTNCPSCYFPAKELGQECPQANLSVDLHTEAATLLSNMALAAWGLGG